MIAFTLPFKYRGAQVFRLFTLQRPARERVYLARGSSVAPAPLALVLAAILVSMYVSQRDYGWQHAFGLSADLFVWRYVLSALAFATIALLIGFPAYMILRRLGWTSIFHCAFAGFALIWIFSAAPDLYHFATEPLPTGMILHQHFIVKDDAMQPFGWYWLLLGVSADAMLGAMFGIFFWVLMKGWGSRFR